MGVRTRQIPVFCQKNNWMTTYTFRCEFFSKVIFALLLWTAFLIFTPSAGAAEKPYVPDLLSPWEKWVLHEMDPFFCPKHFRNQEDTRCVWFSSVSVTAEKNKGDFTGRIRVFAQNWVRIPGDMTTWPENVGVNGKKAVVIPKNGFPHIFLSSGEYEIKGDFSWKEAPNSLYLPEQAGIVFLQKGKEKISPILEKDGRLWLNREQTRKKEEDRMDVSIFRRITDSIPMEVETRIRLRISGKEREEKLEKVLPENSFPMNIQSPLPVDIGNQNSLIIQARPGIWELVLVSGFAERINRIGPLPAPYGREFWSFAERNDLRMVRISGVPGVDPSQTDLPAEWKKLPAYIVESGDIMVFEVLKRGDANPPPDRLSLDRTVWMDFDGKGYTFHDKITGTVTSSRYISIPGPMIPGRVSVNGKDRLITAREKGKPGVEFREGNLTLNADLRLDKKTRSFSAIGWDHEMESLRLKLNLPPGWEFFTARGADGSYGELLMDWTLWDIFFLLLVALIFWKMASPVFGGIALAGIFLIYHEPNAPLFSWLLVLAAAALLQVLPNGFFRKFTFLWGGISLLLLLVWSLIFGLQETRSCLYPQLEKQEILRHVPIGIGCSHAPEKAMEADSLAQRRYAGESRMTKADPGATKKLRYAQDPDTHIQTGPGLPSWQVKTVHLTWTGPVTRHQELSLILVPPWGTRILSFLRVVFLALMLFGVAGIGKPKKSIKTKAPAISIIALALVLSCFATASASGSWPDPGLLNTLKTRLTRPDECFPVCADLNRITFSINEESLRIDMEVHSATDVAVPLPAGLDTWMPDLVVLGKDRDPWLAKDEKGALWIRLEPGIHRIVLTGGAYEHSSIRIPLPMLPKHASSTEEGWEVEGIREDGKTGKGILFTRTEKKEKTPGKRSSPKSLPPFFHVERTLSLGIKWQVFTRVERITPAGVPASVSIPLLPGESVASSKVKTENRSALVTMGAKEGSVSWVGALDITNSILLKSMENTVYTETWILDASPVWHVEHEGIPPVLHRDQNGDWRPKWRPWPKEKLSLKITRPKAFPGKVITLEGAKLYIEPGKRITNNILTFSLRSSKGMQHEITLPKDAALKTVSIDNQEIPIRMEERKITLPIQPKLQSVKVQWTSETLSRRNIRAPEVHLGMEAVNAEAEIVVPANRWILFTGGPDYGPAVLFWTYLIVVAIVAFGLSRFNITPLSFGAWFLLGLGLTQVHPFIQVFIAFWLILLGLRARHVPSGGFIRFNFIQLCLICITIFALFALYHAIQEGLLGIPDMQVAGGKSYDYHLRWFADRIPGEMPRPWVISVSIFWFHGVMLLWSLWLAISLVKWLKWGWACFSTGRIFAGFTWPFSKPGKKSGGKEPAKDIT